MGRKIMYITAYNEFLDYAEKAGFTIEQIRVLSYLINSIDRCILNEKDIWNIDELCDYLHLSKSHIYKLTKDNKIPHYKNSKCLYFERKEILDWIRNSSEHIIPNDNGKVDGILKGDWLFRN